MKKNLTLSLDESLLDRARIYAAMRKTSVNAMIRDFLSDTVSQGSKQDAVTRKLLKLSRESTGRLGDHRPSRADTYSGSPRFDGPRSDG